MTAAPFQLAACAEMLFAELPIHERARRLSDMSFLVEIWDWTRHDIDALAASGARFSSMTGHLAGALTDEAGAALVMEGARRSIQVARSLGCPRLNLHGTALGPDGSPVAPCAHPTPAMWLKARETLARLAALGEAEGVTFVLENLNTAVDHPGVPFARAEETLALVAAVNSPALRLNLDLYHAQIGEGNLIALCRRALPWIGEIQVADVPGRMQPGTGEVRWPAVARALRDMGYAGVIGMEAWPSGDDALALEQFRAAFTL